MLPVGFNLVSRIRTKDKFNQKHKFSRYLLTLNADQVV